VLAAYYGQVEMIDHGVGRILDTLESQGLRENTVVVFTADHGDHNTQFGWYFKGTMYEHAVRVPLLVDDPSGATGEVCDHAVSTIDLYPTLLERCGVPVPEGIDAESFLPLVERPGREDWDDETYAECGSGDCLVRDGYKLIRRELSGGATAHELYDVTTTPTDAEDLWEDPDYADRRETLRDRLEERSAAIQGD